MTYERKREVYRNVIGDHKHDLEVLLEDCDDVKMAFQIGVIFGKMEYTLEDELKRDVKEDKTK